MPSWSATLTLTTRAWGATAAMMPARCVPCPKASRLRSSSIRASSEKSGPSTTWPASAASGETPESISATSAGPPLAVSAPTVARSVSSVVLGVAGASLVERSVKRRSALTERTPGVPRSARTALRGTRAENPRMSGISRSTRPPRPCTARSGPLPVPASFRTTTRKLRGCADAGEEVKAHRTAMAQKAVREIPQRSGMRRNIGHKPSLGPRTAQAEACGASPGDLGSLWKLWRRRRQIRLKAREIDGFLPLGCGNPASLPMTGMCNEP